MFGRIRMEIAIKIVDHKIIFNNCRQPLQNIHVKHTRLSSKYFIILILLAYSLYMNTVFYNRITIIGPIRNRYNFCWLFFHLSS